MQRFVCLKLYNPLNITTKKFVNVKRVKPLQCKAGNKAPWIDFVCVALLCDASSALSLV